MNPITLHRIAAVSTAISLLAINVLMWIPPTARADDSELPAFNEATATARNSGKIVWADLFTSDAPAAAKFYGGLFGWTSTNHGGKGWNYTMMRSGGRPVAGIIQRSASQSARQARWIEYIAVPDISATLAAASAAGGRVLAPARSFPRRGTQAIIADNEGSLIGVLQSLSGDPADAPSQPGEWTWYELFARDPGKAAGFYSRVFAYQVAPDTRPNKGAHFIFSTGAYRRAGVAPVPNYPDAAPDWLGFVHVSDIEAVAANVSALGGEIISEPTPSAYSSRHAIIADPTGGTLGLVQFTPEANSNDATVPAGTHNPNP